MLRNRPANELQRLQALHATNILDTPDDSEFDRLTELAQLIFDTPIAAIAMVDADRVWMKAVTGMAVREFARDAAFCSRLILREEPLAVADAAKDPRFCWNPMVVGPPGIRFYLGACICSAGLRIGSFCVMDMTPRPEPTESEVKIITLLAEHASKLIQIRYGDTPRLADSAPRTDFQDPGIARRIKHLGAELMTALDALRETNGKLDELAVEDPLTGLSNRRVFEERLSHEVNRAMRYKTPLSLVMVEVDELKAYIEEFGIAAGDEMLRSIGRYLLRGIRDSDLAARIGEAEFAIILPQTPESGALVFADRVSIELAAMSWEKRTISVNIGVCGLSMGMDSKLMLAGAHEALYRSRQAGHNQVATAADMEPHLHPL